MELKKRDLEFGSKSEKEFYPSIKPFGFKKTKPFCEVDFAKIKTRQMIELKTRKCKSTQYPSAIIPKSKIEWFLRYKDRFKNARFYFVVKYYDKTVFTEIKESDLDLYELNTILHTYRGDLPKDHYFIDNELFREFQPDIFAK